MTELRSCQWKSRWTSWAPVRNKPTVSVDVKQHFNSSQYRQRLLLRRKGTPVGTDAIARTVEDQELFKKRLIHASRLVVINNAGEMEAGKSRIGRCHWVTDIYYNRNELWTLNYQGCCHTVSSQLHDVVVAVSSHVRCIAGKLDLKINTSQKLFLRRLTTGTHGRRTGLKDS